MNLEYQLDHIVQDSIAYLLSGSNQHLSLFSGRGGIMLFLFLRTKITNINLTDSGIENLFNSSLREAFSNPNHDFSDGLSGIGFMLQNLVDEKIIDYQEVKFVMEQIDEVSVDFGRKAILNGNHDFLYGAVGEMVYLLSRLDHNIKTEKSLVEIGISLLEASKRHKDGIYWTESKLMRAEEEQKYSSLINLGISHGQASKIAILSKLVEKDIQTSSFKPALSAAVNYILSCAGKYTESSIFPSIIENGKGNEASFWWSYGDLGIAIALYQAGTVLSDNSLKSTAVDIFHKYRSFRIQDTGIYEASLCRGTSGIGLMYHHMYLDTGITSFKVTSDYWYDETIKFAGPETCNESAFKFLNNYSQNPDDWFYQNNPNLLMGSAGVGLALLSKITNKKMAWSRCLLIN